MRNASTFQMFRYGILLCLLTTSLLAQEPPAEFKTLHFPPDHPLGRAYLWPSEYRDTLPIDPERLTIDWDLQHKTCLGLAQGNIPILKDQTILLDLPTSNDAQYLTALGPNDVHTLSVPKLSDKNWASIAHLKGLRILKITSFNNSQEGLLNLAKLPTLQALILEHNYAGKTLAKLPPLPQLEYLDIFITPGNHTIGPSDTDLRYLDKFLGLKTIKIFMPRMDGSGLVHLKQLPRLEQLCLAGSGGMTGERPSTNKRRTNTPNKIVHDLSVLKDLTQLKHLTLWEFTFPGSYELLSHMPELETYSFIRVYGSQGFHHLAKLKQHKHFGGQIQGEKNLAVLKTMTHLESVGQVHVPQDPNELLFLSQFPHLKFLGIGTAAQPGELKFLENFTHLTRLEIGCDPFHNAQQAKVFDFEPVRSLTQLERLDLGGMNIEDADLAFLTSLSQLKEFNLNTNHSGDQCLQYIGQLPQLERLELFGGMEPLTVAGLSQLNGLSHLTHLIIHGGSRPSMPMAMDILPLDLSDCPNLERLRLQSVALRDRDLAWLAGHLNLRKCMIDTHKQPPLSSKVIPYFATLPQLGDLYLGRIESIDPTDLESLTQLKHLHYLSLKGDIDPESLSIFKDHPTLYNITLYTPKPIPADKQRKLRKTLSPTTVHFLKIYSG